MGCSMPEELFLLAREDGSFVDKVFLSLSAVDEHLDGLGAGAGTEDNARLRSDLEVRRYVIAAMEAA